jgi:DNA-binding PadR family transcriptional regulator
LLCALHRGPLTGYDLVRTMRKPIGYYWTAPQSQIYPELNRLTDAGLIEHEEEAGPGPRLRKTHQLTEAGRQALAGWLPQPVPPSKPRDEAILKTFAQSAADPVQMRQFYLGEAEKLAAQLADLRPQQASLQDAGADQPDHPMFGAYATLQYALQAFPVRMEWYRWMAREMQRRAEWSDA